MASEARTAHVTRFRSVLEHRLGLVFEESRDDFLADLLERRSRAAHGSQEVYLGGVERELSVAERRALARELTVGETYFFRNPDQFRALRARLPTLGRPRATATLRMLSAACASGEEPYSLAIVARELGLEALWQVSIRAVDLNAEALAKAALGRYSAWALRELDEDARRRWFTQDGQAWVVAPALRGAVSFEEKNLCSDDDSLWLPSYYDIVFCRNVLMYLSHAQAERLVARIAASLVPGGLLFLGHAETLRGLSSDFHLHHTHETFYYERKPCDLRAHAAEPAPRLPELERACEVPTEWTSTWLDTVQRASTRIDELASQARALHAKPHEARHAATPTRSTLALDGPLDLMRRERFAEALDALDVLGKDAPDDLDVLLLRAALLTHRVELAAAEQACEQLLSRDELNAGAHYLLALCRERAGDLADAREQDQLAAYLDPAFAMPRLHLGLMARRSGDLDAARRELGKALLLLRSEDAARILLFGGGFHRDALLGLCRAELVRAGGTP